MNVVREDVEVSSFYSFIKHSLDREHFHPIEEVFNKEKDNFIDKNLSVLLKEGFVTVGNRKGYNFNGTSRVKDESMFGYSVVETDIPIHPSLLEEITNKESLFDRFSLYKKTMIQYLYACVSRKEDVFDFLRKYKPTSPFYEKMHKNIVFNPENQDKDLYEYLKNNYMFFEGLRLVTA